jgi:tetratricopeptide (TPR) repeat protein
MDRMGECVGMGAGLAEASLPSEAWQAQAIACLAEGQTNEALNFCWQRLTENLDCVEALMLAARAYLQSNRLPLADAMLVRAYALAPQRVDLALLYSEVCLSLARPLRALRVLDALTDTDASTPERQLRRVRCLFRLGRLGEALRMLRRLERRDGLTLAVCRALGECYFRARKATRAFTYLGRLLQETPEDLEVLNWLATLYRELGQWENAALCGQRAQQLAPSEPRYLGDMAEALMVLNQLDDAEFLLTQALSQLQDPQTQAQKRQQFALRERLASIQYLRRRRNTLPPNTPETTRPAASGTADIVILSPVSVLDEESPVAFLARRLQKKGHRLLWIQPFEARLQDAATTAPHPFYADPFAWQPGPALPAQQMGRSQILDQAFPASGKTARLKVVVVAPAHASSLSDSQAAWLALLEAEGFQVVPWTSLDEGIVWPTALATVDMTPSQRRTLLLEEGIALHQAGQGERALTRYDRILAEEPDNLDAMNLKGVLLIAARRAEEAEPLLRRLLTLAPNHPEAHNHYGLVMESLKRFEEAAASFQTAVQLDPAYAAGWVNLAHAHFRLGDVKRTVRALRRGLRAHPEHLDLLKMLGQIYQEQKKFQRALACQQQVLHLAPNDPNALMRAMQCHSRLGHLPQAQDCVKRLLTLEPDNLTYYEMLVELQLANGQLQEAEQVLQSASLKAQQSGQPIGSLKFKQMALERLLNLSDVSVPEFFHHPTGDCDVVMLALGSVAETGGGQVNTQAARAMAAAGHRVLFVEQWSRSRILNPDAGKDEPFVVYPDLFMTTKRDVLTAYQSAVLDQMLALAFPETDQPRRRLALFYIFSPYLQLVAEKLRARGFEVAYWCIDHWQDFTEASYELRDERKLALAADHLFATSSWLQRKMERLTEGRPCTVIRNGFSRRNFPKLTEKPPRPDDLRMGSEKTFLYWGTLTEDWVDWQLIGGVARRNPGWTFNFIGIHDAANPVFTPVAGLPNVHFLGKKTVSELQPYGVHADIGIIHFKINDLTAAVDPIKSYEYLACGLPLLSTVMPELSRMPYTWQIDSVEAFEAAVREIEATELDPATIEAFLDHETWDCRAEAVLASVGEAKSAPDVLSTPTVARSEKELADLQSRAMAAHQAGQIWEALALYDELLAARPADLDLLNLKGLVLLDCRQPAAAERILRQVLSLAPQNAQIHNNYGLALEALGRREEAQQAFETALRLDPADAYVWLNLAQSLMSAGQTRRALLTLRRGLRRFPKQTDLLRLLASVYRDGRKFGKAATVYQQLLAQEPDNLDLLWNLTRCLSNIGDIAGAKACAERILKFQPNQPDAYFWMMTFHLMDGTLDEGAALLEQARRHGAQSPKVVQRYQMINDLKRWLQHSEVPAAYYRPTGEADIVFVSTCGTGVTGGGQQPAQLSRGLAAQGHRLLFVEPWTGTSSQNEPFAVFTELPYYNEMCLSDFRKQLWNTVLDRTFPETDGTARAKLAVFVTISPYLLSLAKHLKSQGFRIVYGCIDDWNAFDDMPVQGEWERALLRIADEVVATSAVLADKMTRISNGRPCHVIRNGFSRDNFPKREQPPARPTDLVQGAAKTLIYWGAITQPWVDWSLVAAVAERHPDWAFNFIGPLEAPERLDGLRHLGNLHFLGPKSVSELQAYGEHADAAIIHFEVSPLTQAVNPIKAYEYLACGLPVVATPMPELNALPHVVQAEGVDAFERALAGADRRHVDRAAMEAFLDAQTWETRAKTLIETARPAPETSTQPATDLLKNVASPVLLSQAIEHHQAGTLGKALHLYDRILAKEPGCVDALNLKGLLLIDLKQFEEAEAILRHACERLPQEAVVAGNHALALEKAGRPLEAIAEYERALRLKPDHLDAGLNLAGLRLARLELPEALRGLLRLWRFYPGHVEIAEKLAYLYLTATHYGRALRYYNYVLPEKPDHPELLHQIGKALMMTGRFEDAQMCFDRCVALDPGRISYREEQLRFALVSGDLIGGEMLVRNWPAPIADRQDMKLLGASVRYLYAYEQGLDQALTAQQARVQPFPQPAGELDIVFVSPCTTVEAGGGQHPPQIARCLARDGHRVLFTEWYTPIAIQPERRPDEPFAIFSDPCLTQEAPMSPYLCQLWDKLCATTFPEVEGGPRRKVALFTTFGPYLERLADKLREKGFEIAYWCLDHWQGFSATSPIVMARREQAIVRRADHLLATSGWLAEKMRRFSHGRPCGKVSNGFSNASFQTPAVQPDWPADLVQGEKTIIYWGNLTTGWVDWEFFHDVAAAHPDWAFNLIGPYEKDSPRIQHVFPLKNVHFLGAKPATTLQPYGLHADLGIIHFKVNELTEAVNPVKAYEYLACGLPIVSTPMPELDEFPYTRQVRTAEEFTAAAEELFHTPMDRARIDAFLADASWEGRARQFVAALSQSSPSLAGMNWLSKA